MMFLFLMKLPVNKHLLMPCSFAYKKATSAMLKEISWSRDLANFFLLVREAYSTLDSSS